MRVPNRKPGKYAQIEADSLITEEKFFEYKSKLDKLLNINRPKAIEEVKRLALLGDFSENVEYQFAKGRLRGINNRIVELENILKRAEIIKPNKNNNAVQIGHTVTLETNGKTKVFRILGSAEADPASGAISHQSPLGSILLGKKVGEKIGLKLKDKTVEYVILKID